ncbi:hypothetical protein B484DRAFT_453306 [Ochromonadaceae sp. CCMP2298]|nr:hypothetical protein B484DRAFT_453306 [Ochromonadaceae sp. CCMP2298]|mmetsp:Transcript_7028/g.15360  ORF Transcript_7028/g.15360 Transcript_7028/m.15360 type:complete len:516 (-) Transcript_7028:240-1787(-)
MNAGGGPPERKLPRQLTAVGTVGEQNQLFTIYEKNWTCKDCGQENYPKRPRCFQCKKAKPEGVDNIVMDPAYEALKAGKDQEWQEVVDPSSYQIYYHNKLTGHTQWERPMEMGAAPFATGWFGRGAAGSSAAQHYYSQNTRLLLRPARKQKDYVDPKKYHTEGNNELNIWYGRYMGDNDKNDREPAADRCVVERDAGATKADSGSDAQRRSRVFCMHFAHGACAKGDACTYYHRIPLPADDKQVDEMTDCFGRTRHSKHKDDMGGVGTFMKPCRTLFVGGLLKAKYTPKELEQTLWKHFGEWGEVESLNVIHRLSIAFPRFRLRTSAEFAKEAMTNQALEQGEVLSIKWAHDDPNPVAKEAIDRADADAMMALLNAKGISTAPAPFSYPPEYNMPAAKLDEGLALHPDLAYPDTDHQYAAGAGTVTGAGAGGDYSSMTAEEYKTHCDTYSAQQSALARLGLLSSSGASGGVKRQREQEQVDPAWSRHRDEGSGAYYYFNSSTGESCWTKPEGASD